MYFKLHAQINLHSTDHLNRIKLILNQHLIHLIFSITKIQLNFDSLTIYTFSSGGGKAEDLILVDCKGKN